MEDSYHVERYGYHLFCTASVESHVSRFLLTLHVLLAITSTCGNALVLTALRKESSLHPPSKILLRSLAVTDLCVGILLEPLFIAYFVKLESKDVNHCLELVEPAIYISQVATLASLSTLTAISVDRLLALLLGIRYRLIVTCKRVLVIVICLWILSITSATAVFWASWVAAHCLIFVDLFCVLMSNSCYFKIYFKARYQQAQIQGHSHHQPANGHEPLHMARYRKTVSTALWIQFSLLFCYLPIAITISLMVFRTSLDLPVVIVIWMFSITLVYFNSTLNPILYCWKIREVRRAVKEIVKMIWCCLST